MPSKLRWMEAASGREAARVGKVGMIVAMTSKVILRSQLLHIPQSFLPHSDSSDGLVGGLHMCGCPINWAQIVSLISYDLCCKIMHF